MCPSFLLFTLILFSNIQNLPEFVIGVKTLLPLFSNFLNESNQAAGFVFFKAIDANNVVVREIIRTQS